MEAGSEQGRDQTWLGSSSTIVVAVNPLPWTGDTRAAACRHFRAAAGAVEGVPASTRVVVARSGFGPARQGAGGRAASALDPAGRGARAGELLVRSPEPTVELAGVEDLQRRGVDPHASRICGGGT